MNYKPILITIAITILVVVGMVFVASQESGEYAGTELEPFAQCIADSGATFWGAFWCGHCQNQKRAFGAAEEFLPYVECSTPDGRGQLAVCAEAQITGYPTWEFADGTRLSGEVPLSQLADITGCELPSGSTSSE
jgi:hypothetical protein